MGSIISPSTTKLMGRGPLSELLIEKSEILILVIKLFCLFTTGILVSMAN